ncbi:MAG: hypothetical protein RIQ59_258 [Bacteroidota bacterium]|jgi:hypothetical protein
MKKIINYLIVLFSFTFMSCNSYKFVFFPATQETVSKISKGLEYVIKDDELYLVFTKDYHKTKIKALENNKVFF